MICLSTSNPTKSHTPNVGQEHIFGNGFGRRISHYTMNRDVPQENFPLCNHVSNVMTSNVYVLGFPIALKIFCMY